ncbi:hypothetical protein J4N42_15715 [Vibrio sp. SCSIO 43135]|uniref:Uncharacterized protein n=1 Tax=Vibrio paucivorans TaxID=2829489 RepID=A0A9X3CHN1_9VIBR|nr:MULTISPECIES: hypothetical protein [Vibrio]MCW8335549.1 hypothetical protein [Vibrio paucivorans]USD43623.1 hypothetical protein J4N42_15715 [Vibrio sp. SCSIO 43135]
MLFISGIALGFTACFLLHSQPARRQVRNLSRALQLIEQKSGFYIQVKQEGLTLQHSNAANEKAAAQLARLTKNATNC